MYGWPPWCLVLMVPVVVPLSAGHWMAACRCPTGRACPTSSTAGSGAGPTCSRTTSSRPWTAASSPSAPSRRTSASTPTTTAAWRHQVGPWSGVGGHDGRDHHNENNNDDDKTRAVDVDVAVVVVVVVVVIVVVVVVVLSTRSQDQHNNNNKNEQQNMFCNILCYVVIFFPIQYKQLY